MYRAAAGDCVPECGIGRLVGSCPRDPEIDLRYSRCVFVHM